MVRDQVWFFDRDYTVNLHLVVDELSDIVCSSRFAASEVEREKSVVREEIFACEDNPEDKINEVLAGQVWGAHSLGRPILGTLETVESLSPEALREYFRRRYRPEHLVVAAAGSLEHDRVAELVERHLQLPGAEVEAARGQIRGGLIMAQESVSSRMYQLAHDELYHGRYMPPDEQVARILAVTRDEVAEAALDFAAPERFALAALGPAAGNPLSERDWPTERAPGEPVLPAAGTAAG